MKKQFLLLLFIAMATVANAQITTVVSRFTSNLTKNDLPFSGDRKLYAIGLDDRNTKNYIVVSKNRSGADHDELYIEKFTEKGDGTFTNTLSKKFEHPTNLSLSFSNNQMTYQDSDKDGDAEWMYIIHEHEAGPGTPVLKTYGVSVYKSKANLVWKLADDGFTKNHFDNNFKNLPAAIQQKFLEFWDKVKYD